MNALELQSIYLRRGNFILRDIHFTIEEGRTAVLVGDDGAGKSTLIGLIGNALLPDAGKILYFGKELCEDEVHIRKSISVMYDSPNFNVEMKAAKLAQEISRFEPWFDMELFHRGMEKLGLPENERVKLYSHRKKKKYMLLLALCRKPSILVMDEPFWGVMQEDREKMWEFIGEYRKTQQLTILFSTNDMENAMQHADCLLELKGGTIV